MSAGVDAVIVVSALSATFSGMVVLTGLIFEQMRKRFFMQIIMFVSFGDFVVALSSCFGFPPNGSVLCTVQGFLITFFLRSSWFWTTMLSYQLHNVVVIGKFNMGHLAMHGTVWGLSLLFAVLPLAMATYGRSGTDTDVQICFLSTSNTEWILAWSLLDFFVLCSLCTIIMLFFLFKIHMKVRQSTQVDALCESVFNTLYLYPIVLMVSWLPTTVINVVLSFVFSTQQDSILTVAACFANTYGIWLGVVFCVKSAESRQRWYQLLFSVQEEDFDDDTIVTDFQGAEEYEIRSPPLSTAGRVSLSMSNTAGRPSTSTNINVVTSPLQDSNNSTFTDLKQEV